MRLIKVLIIILMIVVPWIFVGILLTMAIPHPSLLQIIGCISIFLYILFTAVHTAGAFNIWFESNLKK